MQNNSSNELSELLSVLEKELFDACSISKMLQCALSDEREFKSREIYSICELIAEKISISKALFCELKEIV